MPLYNTASCAVALDVSPKWLDNLLSHHKVLGVQQAKQGIPRRLSAEAVEIIAVAHSLSQETNLPIANALQISHDLCSAPSASIAITPLLSISVDLHLLRQTLSDKLARAMEITPQPLRGRPPKPR